MRRVRPVAADRCRKVGKGAEMFQQVCFIIAVCLLLARWVDADQKPRYRCPQCDSANGDHAEGCSWKT